MARKKEKQQYRVIYGYDTPTGITMGVSFVWAIDDVDAMSRIRNEARMVCGQAVNIYSVKPEVRDN